MVHAINFNAMEAEAALKGQKTQKRLPMSTQPFMDAHGMWHWKDCQWMDGGLGFPKSGIEDYAPFQTGDILYVLEPWAKTHCATCISKECSSNILRNGETINCADGTYVYQATDHLEEPLKWHSATSMPSRSATRLWLQVKDVRVERLQDCGCAQAKDEGYSCCSQFARIWNEQIKQRTGLSKIGWESNPFVWVVCFECCEAPKEETTEYEMYLELPAKRESATSKHSRVYVVFKHIGQGEYLDRHGEVAKRATDIISVHANYDEAVKFVNKFNEDADDDVTYEVKSYVVEQSLQIKSQQGIEKNMQMPEEAKKGQDKKTAAQRRSN